MYGVKAPGLLSQQCTCGNCKITGAAFNNVQLTGLSEHEQSKIIKTKQQLLLIRESSVTIKNISLVTVIKNFNDNINLQCHECGNIISLYRSRINSFGQIFKNERLSRLSLPPKQNSRNIFIKMPKHFSILFNNSPQKEFNFDLPDIQNLSVGDFPLKNSIVTEDVECENDDDFNLMFCNTTAPIVGSYTDSLVVDIYSPIFC